MADQEIQPQVEQQPTDTPTDQGSFEDLFNDYEVTPNQAAFGETEAFTDEVAPVETPEVGAEEQTPEDNEQVRSTYWQSQADKLRNELEAKDNYIRNLQQQSREATPTTEVKEEPKEEFFPAPPGRPNKPRNFSREEAFSDARSESGQYMDDLEEWRDQMGEYNRLHSQWQIAKMQETQQEYQEEVKQADLKRQAIDNQTRETQQILGHVTEKYGMSQEEANDFMQKMSDPNSISMDNLVELYKMQKGIAPAQPPVNTPSQEFTQVQRAQSVPRPMGISTGVNSQTSQQTDPVDELADWMINTHNNSSQF
jgi:hypothetical protein